MRRSSDHRAKRRRRTPLLVSDTDDETEPQVLLAGESVEESDEGEGETEENERTENSHDVSGPAWQGVVFALLPLLICMFGAGRETWSKGIAAILTGAAMIIFPLQRQLPALARASILATLLAPLSAFLPATWFPQPEWRTRLIEDWHLQLSNTLTPQFDITRETWLFMALCICWLYWCLARGFSSEQRRAMLQVLGLGGVVLSLLSILEHWGVLGVPFWPRGLQWDSAFGPFANRNHMSSIAAISCVLCAACAYDAHRRKLHTWSLYVAGLFIPLALIFINTSRAGLVLFFVGITAWLGTAAMGRGFFKKMTVTISLVLIISTLLVISSGGITARLNNQGVEGFVTAQGRTVIYAQTLEMFLHAPWLGHGLGNFAAVFPQFSDIYNLRERPVHPESDVLWLLAEGGMLTLLPLIIAAFWWFSATGPWFRRNKRNHRSRRNDQRLRNTATIACSLAVMHGIFDVPNRGLGYFAFVALLAGIAIRPRRLPQPAGIVSQTIMRAGGVSALVLGGMWLAVSAGNLVLPGSSSAAWLRQNANRLADEGAYADALPLFDKAVQLNPLDYRLYFERARVRLFLHHPPNDALDDFSRARALEPNDTDMCYREGLTWLDFRPEFAIIPWREIIKRWPGYYFSTLMQHSQNYPQLREPLWNLATTAELKLMYLSWVNTRDEFERCLRSLLSVQPDLGGLDVTQREQVFRMWYQLGDRSALISALETNRKWRDVGWRILAEHYASNSDFQRACQIASAYLPSLARAAPGTSSDIPALERALLYNPTDPRRVIDLFQAQKNVGDLDGALRTLERVAESPEAPTYVKQEIAALYIMKQDFRRAWENLREAMQKR